MGLENQSQHKESTRRTEIGHNKQLFLVPGDILQSSKRGRNGSSLCSQRGQLSKWEQENIYNQQWSLLKLYKRYIDDILIMWEGPLDSLLKFIEMINANKYGQRHGTTHQLII